MLTRAQLQTIAAGRRRASEDRAAVGGGGHPRERLKGSRNPQEMRGPSTFNTLKHRVYALGVKTQSA